MGWAAKTMTKTGMPMRTALVSTVTETIGAVNSQAEAIIELRHVVGTHHAELDHLKAERDAWLATQATFLGRMRWLLKGVVMRQFLLGAVLGYSAGAFLWAFLIAG